MQTVVIPRHQPRDEDDWSTPEELGLVRPSAPSLLHLAKGNPRDSTPTKATAQRPMSPWRLQEQIINTPGAWLNSQPPLPPGPPPPPMQPRPPPAAPAAADPGEELDEFDQGLLRDAVGGVGIVAPGAAPSGAGIKPVLAPPLPQHQTSLAPSAAMIPPSGAPAKDGMVVHQPASAQTAPAGAPHNAAPVRPPPPPLPNAQMGWGGAVEGAPMVAQQMPGGLHPGVALAAHQQQQHMQQQYMMQMQAHAQMMQQQEAQMAMAQQQHMLGMGGPVPMQVYAGGPVAMHGFPQAPGQVYGIRPPMQPQPHLGPGRPPGPMGGMQNGGRMW